MSSGLGGGRYEYLKLVLDDDVGFQLFFCVCEKFPNGDIPSDVVGALKFSKLTALRKNNGKVRGVSAGDILRRLVSKVLARQFQKEFRCIAEPSNFGLCNRSGTDTLVHLIKFLLDESPDKVVVSIDGVGAFDHICRTQIFDQLREHSELQSLIPFFFFSTQQPS